MTILPAHGRIDCARCFPGGAKWGITTVEEDGWILENNPLAWGARNPRYLVLGFSKGARQCERISAALHDDIPYAGFRHNLTAILRKLGLLGSEERVEDRIRDSEADFAFGSLIRCSVARVDPVTGVASKSGDIINRLSRRGVSDDWALNCMRQFLAELPSRLEVVVLLSNDNDYIEACFHRLRSLHPSMKRLNSVAYSEGRVTWVHTVHGSSLAQSHINAWLEGGNTAQGLKQRAAVEAIRNLLTQELPAARFDGVGAVDELRSVPAGSVCISRIEEPTTTAEGGRPSIPAQTDSSEPAHGSAFRFERLSPDSELFLAHRYEDGLYRVANPALGPKKHHTANQISVDIGEIAGYLKRGYLLRMRGEKSNQVNLISPSEIKIVRG